MFEEKIKRLTHHGRLVYVRPVHLGFEALFLIWTHQNIDGTIVPLRPCRFCGPHGVELYIQLLTLSIPLYCVSDAALWRWPLRDAYCSRKARPQHGRAQSESGLRSRFLSMDFRPGMSTDASNQRCKIIRQLCHPVNQIHRSLFKMLLTVSSGPYLHELQIPLGILRLLECQ